MVLQYSNSFVSSTFRYLAFNVRWYYDLKYLVLVESVVNLSRLNNV